MVKGRFGASVSPVSLLASFHLVISLSRSSLRVNSDTIALMLQASLGGTAADFQVLWLKNWCFRFTVSSKQVGFMINKLRKVIMPLFIMHFALWHDGGPDHVKEKARWDREQDEEWHLVTRSKKSYVAAVKS